MTASPTVKVTVELTRRDYEILTLMRASSIFFSDADVMKLGLVHLARHFDIDVTHEDFAPTDPQLALFPVEAQS